MGAFSGTEPLVGELIGVRTFRVDDFGLLLPLYSNEAWYDGVNTAKCTPPTGENRSGAHAVPAENCECGFYAYGTAEAAQQNRQMRYVQAIVSCWGGVVAGTKGFRAEHARIDAIWLDPDAPRWLHHRIRVRYPSARVYNDRDAMFAEHPLSDLSCYEPPQPRRPATIAAGAVGLAALLALGLLPYSTLSTTHGLWELWIAMTTCAVATTVWLTFGMRGVGHLGAAYVMAGVVAWLFAPTLGLSGWLLRLPLLRGVVVLAGGYLLALRPHYFPLVKTPKERPFCGVHP